MIGRFSEEEKFKPMDRDESCEGDEVWKRLLLQVCVN